MRFYQRKSLKLTILYLPKQCFYLVSVRILRLKTGNVTKLVSAKFIWITYNKKVVVNVPRQKQSYHFSIKINR